MDPPNPLELPEPQHPSDSPESQEPPEPLEPPELRGRLGRACVSRSHPGNTESCPFGLQLSYRFWIQGFVALT